ncbi:signal peptidase II [Rhabdothermincola salaria]|uniref:signal peptidase II n=1 Tax=Rhabdothermincola salaria TaxID=2903142 RepID=UPI001E5582AC|nr:signal peptidase II [Rhabdothermincola salaria]MCD9622491.1 signal peptidase II [Rhabdothermincola salaria]
MTSPRTSGARGGGGLGSAGTHRVLFATVAIGWLLADQLTKSWAESALLTRNIDLVGSLRFNLAYNTGASFGLGSGYGAWISVVALVVVAILLWQGRSVGTRLGAVALGMIVGGAIGNIVDRAFRGDDGFMSGDVVDFVDLQWWPIFNVADVGIVVGGILLVWSTLRVPEESDEPDAPIEPDGPDPSAGEQPDGAGDRTPGDRTPGDPRRDEP